MKKNKLWIVVVSLLFIDMLSKIIIRNSILLGDKVVIIKNFFNLTYVKNTGGAFSIMRGNTWIIILITSIIIFGLIYYVMKHDLENLELYGYGLVIGGSIGNLFDRIVYGYVIDFIDIYIFKYDYPVFNLADSAIVIGVILLAILMFRGDKNEVN